MDKPQGGTELQRDWLFENLPKDLLSRVQLMCRPEEMDPERVKVLWVQDMPLDVPFLTSEQTRLAFAKIVFVSSWQQSIFHVNAGVPYSAGKVIRNAIHPIQPMDKFADDTIRLIYHPTPHRGLQILVPVFERLVKRYPNLHLDVFSNFDLYARAEANKPFEALYERCRQHPNITYHGSQPNEVVRQALAKAHIFAYPSIWRETSCMSAMEAMSARCLVVAPDYGALSETLAQFNLSYTWTEDQVAHADIFEHQLSQAIDMLGMSSTEHHLDFQKEYADRFYNKETRLNEWISFLSTVDYPKLRPKTVGGITWTPRPV